MTSGIPKILLHVETKVFQIFSAVLCPSPVTLPTSWKLVPQHMQFSQNSGSLVWFLIWTRSKPTTWLNRLVFGTALGRLALGNWFAWQASQVKFFLTQAATSGLAFPRRSSLAKSAFEGCPVFAWAILRSRSWAPVGVNSTVGGGS